MAILDSAKSWFFGTLSGKQSANVAPVTGGAGLSNFVGTESCASMPTSLQWPLGLPGYGIPCPPSIETYRAMRSHPTVAICRMAATAGIRGSAYSVEADDDAPIGAKDYIDKMVKPLWSTMKNDGLYSLDYGWQAFEKIWAVNGGYYTVARLKSLNVACSTIKTDDNGGYIGIKNTGGRDAFIPAEKTWLLSYDSENGNLYGRSRHENIRTYAYSPWVNLFDKQGKIFSKLSAVIPQIRYPEGQSKDAAGKTRSNFDIASEILAKLTRGDGIAMPNTLAAWAEDAIRGGVDVSQLAAWTISFLEANGSSAGPTLEALRYLDELMMRGWFVPGGAISNEQIGSQAKAGANADLALAMSEQDKAWLVQSINSHIIDDVLAINWGESARGKVRITTPPLVDTIAAAQRRIIEAALSGQGGLALLEQTIDLEKAIRDVTGFSEPAASEPYRIDTPDPATQTITPEPEETPSPATP